MTTTTQHPSFSNTSEAELLQIITERIRSVIDAEKIVLFGSRARGDARPDSDFDALVIAESDKPRYKRGAPIYLALADFWHQVDVVVYTPAEVEEWRGARRAFVTTALREGKVLYEKQH